MKVLMIARRSWPDIGGVEKHIFEVGAILKQRGYKISVVTEKEIGYPHIPILGLFWIWVWFLFHQNLVAQADIVHVHDVFIWYLPLRFLFFKKPVYVTVHGWEGKFPVPLRYKLIRQLSSRFAWGIICVGDYIKKWYGIPADYVTYGGVSQRVLKYKSQNQKSKIKILFIGRLEKDTDVEIFLEGCELVVKKYPNVQIEFLGDGRFRHKAGALGIVHGFKKNILPYLASARFVYASGYLSMFETIALRKVAFVAAQNPLRYDYWTMSPFGRWAVILNLPGTLLKKIDLFIQYPDEEQELVRQAYKWATKQTWDKVAGLYIRLWSKR